MINLQTYHSCLIVVAHPDDEVLGVGGTIHKIRQLGIPVHIIYATQGKAGRVEDQQNDKINTLQSQLALEKQQACKILDVTFTTLDFPDNRLDSVSRMDLVSQDQNHFWRISIQTLFLSTIMAIITGTTKLCLTLL
ncbi:MAG: PIG-L family deacetylase [Bdellovibrionota bacterium]